MSGAVPLSWGAMTRQLALLAACVALAAFALFQAVNRSAIHYGFDLYHPWAIREAKLALGTVNPYAEPARMGEFASGAAARSPSVWLQGASAFWKMRAPHDRFEPTATPLYYALLAGMPRDYDAARAVLLGLQYLCLGAAVAWLVRLRGGSIAVALCAAGLAAATSYPFEEDLMYGNVSSIQLLVLVAFIAAARSRAIETRPALDRGYLPALALFVLAKPNLALVAVALAAHYGLARGAHRFAVGAALAAASLVAGWAAGAAYFGDAGIWQDWYRYSGGSGTGMLLYSTRMGNMSLVKLLSEGSGRGTFEYALLAAALLAAALLAAASGLGREPARIAPTLRAVMADPWLAASIALVATLCVSPLVWVHYEVLALVPMLRLFRCRERWDFASACVLVAFVAMARPPVPNDVLPAALPWYHLVLMLAWLPLLAAVLAEIARIRREAG